MANQANGRGYHSTGLLLPDGRVLIAGGGQLPGYPVTNQKNAEIYSPPYLFKGLRPEIPRRPRPSSTARLRRRHGHAEQHPQGVAGPARLRDARLRPEPALRAADSSPPAAASTCRRPANANLAPPGYYMLFIVDDNGVPSVSSSCGCPRPARTTCRPRRPARGGDRGLGTADLSWARVRGQRRSSATTCYRSTTAGFTPTAANRIAQPTGTSYADSRLAAGHLLLPRRRRGPGRQHRAAERPRRRDRGWRTRRRRRCRSPRPRMPRPPCGHGHGDRERRPTTSGVAGVQFKLDGANLGARGHELRRTASRGNALGHQRHAHAERRGARRRRQHEDGDDRRRRGVQHDAAPPQRPSPPTGSTRPRARASATAPDAATLGTIASATRTTAGKFGGALSFNGTTPGSRCPTPTRLDLTTAMTLEAWVRPSTLGGYRTVLLKEATGNLTYALYAIVRASRPGAHGRPRGSTPTARARRRRCPPNAWSHIASTWDGDTWRLLRQRHAGRVEGRSTGRDPGLDGVLRMGGNNVWSE